MINDLNLRDTYLDSLEAYVKVHPDVMPSHGCEMIIPEQLIDCGSEMTIRQISGKRICESNGILTFPVNACREDESAILYGYDKALLEQNLSIAAIHVTGQTTCSRWSGQ